MNLGWIKESFDLGNKYAFNSFLDTGSPVRKERGYTTGHILRSHANLLSVGFLTSMLFEGLTGLFTKPKKKPSLLNQAEFAKQNPVTVGAGLFATMLFSNHLFKINNAQKVLKPEEEPCVR